MVKKHSKHKKDQKSVGKTLSDEQERQIIRQLIDTNSQQLKFKFALWTRKAVRHLIKHELRINMPISTIGYYLKQWEFTLKKPIKRTYERKDEKTQKYFCVSTDKAANPANIIEASKRIMEIFIHRKSL